MEWDRLRATVKLAVSFLDNVIDANVYSLPDIEKITKGNRKIGLGVMGYADMLIKMGIQYDSEEGLGTAEELMKFVREEARKASEALGKEKGSFPNFKGSTLDGQHENMRNATVSTIAPTGTISIIAGCSQGVRARVLRRELNSQVEVYMENSDQRYDPQNRAHLAKPYRPAIYVE